MKKKDELTLQRLAESWVGAIQDADLRESERVKSQLKKLILEYPPNQTANIAKLYNDYVTSLVKDKKNR
jgi:hypothetical protein